MKKATGLTILYCLLLAALIAFSSITYIPSHSYEQLLVISASDHGALKSVCYFPIEEKEGEGRLGQKNSNAQFLIYQLQDLSLSKCDKIRFYFAYHIPDFLQGAEQAPLYLTYRSLLI